MKITDKFKEIKLRTILDMFVPIFILEHNWNAEDEYEALLLFKKQYLVKLLVDSVHKGRLAGNVAGIYIDANGNETDKDKATDFIVDEKETCFDIKDVFNLLLAILKNNEAEFVKRDVLDSAVVDRNFTDAGGGPEDDEGDALYPRYKGLEFEGLQKEKFEELKRHYGMLQAEVAKLNKTVGIATNIGLLFYEKGLSKPANPTDFMDVYKDSFAGIPKRLAKAIYNNLPDRYQSFEGGSAKEGIDDEVLDLIIETSVAAGLLCRDEPVKNAKELEAALARYDFELPSDSFVKLISGAFKRVYKHYQDQLA